jgi:tetratricopeptide (TPR) repeat protein
MRTTGSGAREAAVELEQDAARFPEQRSELLREAAQQWQLAGECDRAVGLFTEVVGLGGEDAGYARFSLAEIAFDAGDDAQAWAHLRALENSGPSDVGPVGLVAELLEEREEYESALRWFDRAVGALGADEVARIGESGFPSLNAGLLFGRQRCRRALGLPVDALDRVADVAEANRREFVDLLERAASAEAIGAGRRPDAARMLVWQREEQQRAARRWPQVFPPEVVGNHPQVEQVLQEMCREQGITKVTLIAGTAVGFADYLERTGGDSTQEQVRLDYADEVYAQGRTIAWPPGRNQPCWCGSGRKYKRCCTAPGQGR